MTGFCVSTFLRLDDVGSCAVSGIRLAITNSLSSSSSTFQSYNRKRGSAKKFQRITWAPLAISTRIHHEKDNSSNT